MSDNNGNGFNTEGFLEASDGLNLHYYSKQTTQPRYQIIGVHGLGEHAGRYAWFADRIAADGGSCAIMDLRGHGTSEGFRGHSPNYSQLISDVETMVSQQKLQNIPTFFFGHSLGGGLALSYALKLSANLTPTPIAGFIASSPLLKLSFEPPAWKLFLAQALVRAWPGFSLDRGIDPKVLSRDRNITAAYIADPLNHELVSAALTLGFLEAGESALKNATELKIPTLVMHGGDDQVTDIDASREFAQSAGEIASFKSFPNSYHELINDLNRDEVIATIIEWIQNQLLHNASASKGL